MPAKLEPINAAPTKAFFVDMLVRDIPLEQAVLDLVDNCVDGAKRTKAAGQSPYDGKKVEIELDENHFRIWDNCGGFDMDTARNYAFRFGRPAGATRTPHSIGQFGVGMKRALFKLGENFVVRSATTEEEWQIDVDVPDWEREEDDWHFSWVKFDGEVVSTESPGTEIVVTSLHEPVSSSFGLDSFARSLASLIKSKHRQFIAGGLEISLNGTRLTAVDIKFLFSDALAPGIRTRKYTRKGDEPVSVKIIVGVGTSVPREAGWYVICNGRTVLEADRRDKTGWGAVEEAKNAVIVPAFHNQFARFRGIVSFDCDDASRVPWNTTKTDIDQDNTVWRKVFEEMIELMRPVIDFLNDLDDDIDEHTRQKSPLYEFVEKTPQLRSDEVPTQAVAFKAPTRAQVRKGPKYVKIQYARTEADIDVLKDALDLDSAKAVGERTFDLILGRHKRK